MFLRLPLHSAPKAASSFCSQDPQTWSQAWDLTAVSKLVSCLFLHRIHSGQMVSIPAPKSVADSLLSSERYLPGLCPAEWLLREFCIKKTFNHLRSLQHLPREAWCDLSCSFSPTAGCRFVQPNPEPTKHQHSDCLLASATASCLAHRNHSQTSLGMGIVVVVSTLW